MAKGFPSEKSRIGSKELYRWKDKSKCTSIWNVGDTSCAIGYPRKMSRKIIIEKYKS